MTGPVLIVLAAGRGSRFGGERHKLEQDIDGASLLAHSLGRALASRLPMLVVTTQSLVPAASSIVAASDIHVIEEDAPFGMGHSIAAGVAARSHADGWLLLPADMPMIEPASMRAVAGALAQHPIVYAQYRGRRGHPVGFAAELFSELVVLTGDEGARRLLARYPSHGVEVDDYGVLLDVDTLRDLERLRQRRRHERAALPS